MSDIESAIAVLERIRDEAAREARELQKASMPVPGSYCVYCGDTINGINGNEECPVSRYMARLGTGGVLDALKGEIHGQAHLWSGGHVEEWFNYSGPRGSEKGWE